MLDRSRTRLPLNLDAVSTPRRVGGFGVALTTLLLGIGVLSITAPAHATTYTISADETCNGSCALITDINTANGSNVDDVIDLGGYTITITAAYDNTGNPSGTMDSGLPDIGDATTAGTLTIQNGTIERSTLGGTPQFRILYMDSGAKLTLDHVTLENGYAPDGADSTGPGVNGGSGSDGGAIYNNGTLTVTNSTLSGNHTGKGGGGGAGGASAGNGGNGGAIYNNGSLAVTDTTLSSNGSGNGGNGGGAATVDGGNGGNGGAIYNEGSTLTLNRTTLFNNNAGNGGDTSDANSGNGGNGGNGGAIYSTVALTLTNCTATGNSAGNGTDGGPATDSTNGGDGGSGGAIYAGITLTLTSTTLSGNQTGIGGPGGPSGSAGSAGSGSAVYAAPTPKIDSSILSGNTDLCAGFTAPANGQYNLVTDTSCGATSPFLVGGSTTNAGALDLGSLQDNGGPTDTMALLTGSVAIDAVPTNVCPTTTDQRGEHRPQGSACDAGAFEVVVPSVLEVPTLNRLGLAFLTLLLATAGLALRRRL